ncbi:hypothetical protein [Mesorhizobium sp. SP-1A]|uniref:hypothetical protein n=1 Tax=Mesorhizobium sp. SP-1A TaxID=3077840 RepID=UPI0028F72E0C|nr:hypothetical protein [Mesorhizobium sp. SP-1A]
MLLTLDLARILVLDHGGNPMNLDSIKHYHPIRLEIAESMRSRREDDNVAQLQRKMLAMMSNKKMSSIQLLKDDSLAQEQSAAEGIDDDALSPWRTRVKEAIQEAKSAFLQRGQNIFDMALVSAMLNKVDVDDIVIEDTELPYDAIYMHFGSLPELEYGDGRWIDGVYVKGTGSRFVLTFVSNIPEAEIADKVPVGEMMKRVTSAVTTQIERNAQMSENVASLSFAGDPAIIASKEALAAAVRLAVNGILYLNLPKADVEYDYSERAPKDLVAKAKRVELPIDAERAENRLTSLGWVRVNFVGRAHARTAEEVRQARASGARSAVEPHWRRGHWRRVVVGVGRSGREWRLFQPTIVNPKGAAMVSRGKIHVVQPRGQGE